MRHPSDEEISNLMPLLYAIEDAQAKVEDHVRQLRRTCGLPPGTGLDPQTGKWIKQMTQSGPQFHEFDL